MTFRILLALAVTLFAAAARATVATDVCPAAADPCVVSTTVNVAPGSTLDFGARTVDVKSGGKLSVTSGTMTILAGALHVEAGGALIGVEGALGGTIAVTTTGDIRVDGGRTPGRIDIDGDQTTGEVDFTAGGDIVLAGSLLGRALTDFAAGALVNLTAAGAVMLGGTVALGGGVQSIGGALAVEAGGDVTVTAPIDVSGGDGGDIDITSNGGDVTLEAGPVVNGAGDFGSGGTVTLAAHGTVSVKGGLHGPGAGSALDGGGDGALVDITADTGAVTLAGTFDLSGAPPDGTGGEIDVTAGTDVVLTGAVLAGDTGIDGCGGSVSVSAGGNVTAGIMQVPGGSCGGGSVSITGGGAVALNGEVDADGTLDEGGGTIDATGPTLTVTAKVHANGLDATSPGGLIGLSACTLTVASGGQVQALGLAGGTLLQASGQLTVAGTVQASAAGTNEFQYLDPTKLPVVTGSVTPPATVTQNPALPPCAVGGGAACGNGAVEGTETCDDGNTTPCDGCSATCRAEGCGNGRVECGEECDNGSANGSPGNVCDATCHLRQLPGRLLIPGARAGKVGCLLEWAVENPNDPQTGGFPSTTQTCIDGDPTCDADGATDGGCSFRVAACLASNDPRLPACQPAPVARVTLFHPNPVHPEDAVESDDATALVAALKTLGTNLFSSGDALQLGVPNATRDACTEEVVQRVPHAPGVAGVRKLSAGARDTKRHRLRQNLVTLRCEPNPAVCGNGVVEIGEQCDDGNTQGCDGCSATCRTEGCGDGVVNCGEQCDDGAANGTPGDPCSTTCTELPPALRIPGGGAASTDCLAEWSVAVGSPALARHGLPATKQTCVDGDPTCDFDPTPGTCRFHVWACLGGADARLACPATPVARVDVLRPTPSQSGPAATLRTALLDAVAALGLPGAPGERCTRRLDVDVPLGQRRVLLKTRATPVVDGQSDGDTLKLGCVGPPKTRR
ncbi:MAG TPA: DUF4215 domain-containing protein [Candidatus Binatia bacterium]|nr:DUF4215 domain-containing protein [Candidatus Binatia bacterium]